MITNGKIIIGNLSSESRKKNNLLSNKIFREIDVRYKSYAKTLISKISRKTVCTVWKSIDTVVWGLCNFCTTPKIFREINFTAKLGKAVIFTEFLIKQIFRNLRKHSAEITERNLLEPLF